MKGCDILKSFNKDIGCFGEDLSINYLIDNGYYILEKNYRNKIGEIDIICKKNNLLIFVEVKSRYTNDYGFPIESVTYYKRRKIIKVSMLYVILNKYNNFNIRYDVIEVFFNKNNEFFNINHTTDAFRTY
jgi:putative endonuclease